jgi:pyrroline-5-carboxylate reductase
MPALFVSMKPEELAPVLVSMGCPEEKAMEMASQLHKRAQQLSEQKGKSYEAALAHLLSLMKQGWAAKERGWV